MINIVTKDDFDDFENRLLNRLSSLNVKKNTLQKKNVLNYMK